MRFGGQVLDTVAGEHAPDLWEAMPLEARRELALKACEEAEPTIDLIFDDLRDHVKLYLDLYELSVEKLTEDKALMNEIFKRCGDQEASGPCTPPPRAAPASVATRPS